ncbi:hypothetical protein IMG5_128350 [Ichthyophthirius multifiliis]|uniref:Transmembrane protein n=1 Tax=Ichthyophthirius multifiliis TaxID=5932 RepID=G0QW10_ICHMU|nr:hypothetical protein IMG5_128350 [Ichthyophthirius multifiliis]EGR30603.1 hypothetical protein IMG5_128350 [Ichthyophthirius multifiliis]|eukprot:XP_004032190.1 hypothetical protein IMG5_128350 [Ichthyophthirius multifiliis]
MWMNKQINQQIIDMKILSKRKRFSQEFTFQELQVRLVQSKQRKILLINKIIQFIQNQRDQFFKKIIIMIQINKVNYNNNNKQKIIIMKMIIIAMIVIIVKVIIVAVIMKVVIVKIIVVKIVKIQKTMKIRTPTKINKMRKMKRAIIKNKLKIKKRREELVNMKG